MASVNKVILIGNLGRDPEVRYSPNGGGAMCQLSLATTRNWKDKNTGERVEETEWHRVVLFDRQAEVAGEYLKKGRPVYIEGRLRTRKWQNKEGQDVYTTEIVGETMQLLGGREGGGGGGGGGGASASFGDESFAASPAPMSSPRPAAKPAPARSPSSSGPATGFDQLEDDIPF